MVAAVGDPVCSGRRRAWSCGGLLGGRIAAEVRKLSGRCRCIVVEEPSNREPDRCIACSIHLLAAVEEHAGAVAVRDSSFLSCWRRGMVFWSEVAALRVHLEVQRAPYFALEAIQRRYVVAIAYEGGAEAGEGFRSVVHRRWGRRCLIHFLQQLDLCLS